MLKIHATSLESFGLIQHDAMTFSSQYSQVFSAQGYQENSLFVWMICLSSPKHSFVVIIHFRS